MQLHATDTPNLSQVTNMNSMFNGASSFTGDLSNLGRKQRKYYERYVPRYSIL